MRLLPITALPLLAIGVACASPHHVVMPPPAEARADAQEDQPQPRQATSPRTRVRAAPTLRAAPKVRAAPNPRKVARVQILKKFSLSLKADGNVGFSAALGKTHGASGPAGRLIPTAVEPVDPSLSVDLSALEGVLVQNGLEPDQCGRHARHLRGREGLEVQLTLDPWGRAAAFAWRDLDDTDLTACLETQLGAIRFPRLGRELAVRVTYAPRPTK